MGRETKEMVAKYEHSSADARWCETSCRLRRMSSTPYGHRRESSDE